jgi:hypothetical protein
VDVPPDGGTGYIIPVAFRVITPKPRPTPTPSSSISGRVTDSNKKPLADVTISDGAGHTTKTGKDGTYRFSGLASSTYTFIPSKKGYTFSPASRKVKVPPNATGVDFTGTATGSTEGEKPIADSFTYPIDLSKVAWPNKYGGHTNRPNDWSYCYNVKYNLPYHAGQDCGFPATKASDGTWTNNTPVDAVANGVVRYSSKDPKTTKTYPGGVVIIEHTLPDGQLIYSMYGHLDPNKIPVSATTKEKVITVTKGQRIATVLKPQVNGFDNTHLHWEMRYFYDGSEIKAAPNYTVQCATEPGPGYTYHENDKLAHPDNFQGVIGKNPDGTLKYKFYRWTNPTAFVTA